MELLEEMQKYRGALLGADTSIKNKLTEKQNVSNEKTGAKSTKKTLSESKIGGPFSKSGAKLNEWYEDGIHLDDAVRSVKSTVDAMSARMDDESAENFLDQTVWDVIQAKRFKFADRLSNLLSRLEDKEAEEFANMKLSDICFDRSHVHEAWDKKMKTPESKKGMFKGRTKESDVTDIKYMLFTFDEYGEFMMRPGIYNSKDDAEFDGDDTGCDGHIIIKKNSNGKKIVVVSSWEPGTQVSKSLARQDALNYNGPYVIEDQLDEHCGVCPEEFGSSDEMFEAWDKKMKTPESKKGMFKGRTKESLKSELSKCKSRSKKLHDEDKKEPESLKTKIKELEFALRAKNKFGKVNESENLTEWIPGDVPTGDNSPANTHYKDVGYNAALLDCLKLVKEILNQNHHTIGYGPIQFGKDLLVGIPKLKKKI